MTIQDGRPNDCRLLKIHPGTKCLQKNRPRDLNLAKTIANYVLQQNRYTIWLVNYSNAGNYCYMSCNGV